MKYDSAIDPVCEMRLIRSAAVTTADYCGHPYYFCSSDCCADFTKDPTKYVRVKNV